VTEKQRVATHDRAGDEMPAAVQLRVVDAIVEELWEAGIRRIYGMPGGGSNMHLIDAAVKRGCDFVLVHHEPAAMFMAAGEAEVSGIPGVCLATLGPGVANSINGLAHCKLDQIPLLLITDRANDDAYLHQQIDHGSLVRAAVKSSETIEPDTARLVVRRAIARTLEAPYGAVHLDLSPRVSSAEAGPGGQGPSRTLTAGDSSTDTRAVAAAADVFGHSSRPVLLVGLGARNPDTVQAVRSFVQKLEIPVLATYMAKGVVDEADRLFAGLVTNGTLEGRVLRHADSLLAVGFDTVELMPGPWRWPLPTVTIGHEVVNRRHIPATVELSGNPGALLRELEKIMVATGWRTGWNPDALPSARPRVDELKPPEGGNGIAPADVVRVARRLAPQGTVATVDAGSHMFPATLFWETERPRRFLISNGLSTMGFALPAAIGASLACEDDLVVCFTGDGGLAMVVGELETAARLGVRVLVVVFNDQSLNLIKIKQEQRGETTVGLDFGTIDWAAVATGMGVDAFRVSDVAELEAEFARAVTSQGPTLIDVRVDPAGYPRMLEVIRG
jgi:acetolactate synthase-1/2/3 large subunit